MKSGVVNVMMGLLVGLFVLTGVPAKLLFAEPAPSVAHEVTVFHDPY